MIVRTSTENSLLLSANWLVIGLFDDGSGLSPSLADSHLGALITKLVERKDLSLGAGEWTPLFGDLGHAANAAGVLGLGSKDTLEPGTLFTAGVALTRRLAAKTCESLAIALPERLNSGPNLSAFVEGVVVGTRGPGLRKSEPSRKAIGAITIAGGTDPEVVSHAVIIGDAVNLARELVNTPPAEKAPSVLAERARSVLAEQGLRAEVWTTDRLREERFGGLLGVAAGSDEPPAFVQVHYRQGGDAPVTALVGKGVTFDSGGLSLKPSASMEDMKCDMTGAAVVLATIEAIAKLGVKVNVSGYLAITENMTGGRAMKLGDVLTMRNGKTVEVLNTDAEGRLILADALSYAVEQKPAKILDLATLTGACMVATGTKIAGIFGNDETFVAEIQTASQSTGERVWQLPLDADFLELLKSTVADLKNVGGKFGGASTAAKFLEQFVGETPWVHLDIAGPSWAESESSGRDAGGTGCFVRTLIHWLMQNV